MDAVIYWYTNAGTSKGVLTYDEGVHEEDLDNTDMLTLTTECLPSKRDRLVWQDAAGTWHEHMVDSTKRSHRDSRPRTIVQCSNSIAELYGVRARGSVATTTVQAHLANLLSDTRWTAGTCDVTDTVKMEYWHKNVRTCIAELCELCGGELETEITVGEDGVTARTARIVQRRGSSSAIRQFSYGRNVSGIDREVTADEVYTAVIGYGARTNEEDESDYALRLTVMAVSSASLMRWGVPLPDGTFTHNYDVYTDTNCTSADFLLKQCKKVLATECKPLVRYEFEVPEAGDRLWSDVQLGDVVHCVDGGFDPAIELMERVSHISRRLSGRVACKIAIGKRVNPIVEQFRAIAKVEYVIPLPESPVTEGDLANDGEVVDTSQETDPFPTDVIGDVYDPSEYGDYEPTDMDDYDFDWGGVDGGAYTTDLTPEELALLPQAISITTQPTDLEYTDGETIDFSGIVVTLLDGNGNTYTSAAYPDGIVPFSELIFPESTASIDGASTSSQVTGGPSEVANYGWSYPFGLYQTMSYVDNYDMGVNHRVTTANMQAQNGAVLIPLWFYRQNVAYIIASPNGGVMAKTHFTQTWAQGHIEYDRETTPAGSFTRDGKTVYYYDMEHFNADFDEWSPNIPRNDRQRGGNISGIVAWAAIYGEVETEGTKSVTVQWMRSDGITLEDTYNIIVSENKFANEPTDDGTSDGWTEMEDGFSGSGGGSF